MSSVKLYYFNAKALGEGPRLLLTYGGQAFQDIRFDEQQWLEYKPKMPFGVVPVMEMDCKQYAQSGAISRFLGRKYGLAGKDLEEDFRIDEVMDYVVDIRDQAMAVHYEPDKALSDARHAANVENTYPVLLQRLDRIVGENNGHLALGRLTWADMVFAGMYDYLCLMLRSPDLHRQYPNLKRVVDNVHALPQLKNYLGKRPKTDL